MKFFIKGWLFKFNEVVRNFFVYVLSVDITKTVIFVEKI